MSSQMANGLASLCTPFPWMRYSKKLSSKIDKLRCVGSFTKEESYQREMRLVETSAGKKEDGNFVKLYWLVDLDDGIIVDAKFQAFGQSALLGAAEAACELLIGKNYDQARRLSTTLIDQQARDYADIPAFPKETAPHLNLVLEAIEQGVAHCTDLPLPSSYAAPPVPIEFGEILEGGYPGWLELTQDKKIALIEDVLDRDIRPYIALDAGGIEVRGLNEQQELLIAYKGTCTSCYSSIGTTLSYIQQVLRARIYPSLTVIPDLENLNLH